MTDGVGPSLCELQQALQRHLLGEESPIAAWITDAPPLSTIERLEVYRNAYPVRLIEALRETYPILHKLLGDEVFADLGRAFIAGHPSEHRSIRWYGADLAPFLAENAPYREQPVISEVALLEWTLSEVFDAADAAVIDRPALAAIAPSAWSELKFEFHPSLRQLELLWNAVPVWQAMSRDESPPEPTCAAAAVRWVMWRRNFKNYFRSLESAEAGALDAALAGASFAEICEILCEWFADDAIPLAAANFLGAWVDSGLIASLGGV
jgi:hypothetical protein